VPADFDGWETLSEQLVRFLDFFQALRMGTPGSSAPAPKPGPSAPMS
jgi:hypothetical protein